MLTKDIVPLQTNKLDQAYILVVDDDAIFAQTIADILKIDGYQVSVALSGLDALSKLDQQFHDLVILDYAMPKMNGLQVLYQIRKNIKHVGVVILTGKGSEQLAVEAMKAGSLDYLIKPVEAIQLLKTVRNALQIQKMQFEDQDLLDKLQISNDRLKETQSYLSSLILDSSDSIIGLDTKGFIKTWNTGATRIFGYSPEKMIGNSILDLHKAEQKEKISNLIAKIISEVRSFQFETHRICRDGSFRVLEVTASPIFDTFHKVIGISEISRDVSECRMPKNQFIQTERFAQIGQLASSLAHDIRNPLTAISTQLQMMLLSPNIRDDLLTKLRVMDEEAQKIDELTKCLSRYTRKDDEKKSLLDINVILEEILLLMQSLFRKRGIQISKILDSSLPYLLGFDLQLRHAFLNLILFGYDNMPNGGEFKVFTSSGSNSDQEEYLEVLIFDNGEPIPKSLKSFVMEKDFSFFPNNENARLGLYLAHEIIERHNGELSLDDQCQGGNCTNVRIPLSTFPEAV